MSALTDVSEEVLNLPSILQACQTGSIATVKSILERQRSLVNVKHHNTFPLWVAVSENNKPLVELLIHYGAYVNLVTAEGTPSLYIAAERDNLEILKLLVNSGAQVDIMTKHNATALWIASQRGYLNIVKFLHQKGANIDIINDEGLSALYEASKFGRSDVVTYLLCNKVDLHAKTPSGNEALHVASAKNHLNVVKLLIDAGADIDVLGEMGMTPMMAASKYGKKETLRYLIESGGNMNLISTDPDGGTALHYAAVNNFMKCTTILAESGAQFKKNKQNEYPSQIARRMKQYVMGDDLKVKENKQFLDEGHPKVKPRALSKIFQSEVEESQKKEDGYKIAPKSDILPSPGFGDMSSTSYPDGILHQRITKAVNEHVELVASCKDFASATKVTWLKDHHPISTSDKVTVEKNKKHTTLRITNCDSSDAGLYTVLMSCENIDHVWSTQVEVSKAEDTVDKRMAVYSTDEENKNVYGGRVPEIIAEMKRNKLEGTKMRQLQNFYSEFLQEAHDLPDCILQINKGTTRMKIFITHNGDSDRVSQYLQEKFPELWKKEIFELTQGLSTSKLVGKVTIVKTGQPDRIHYGSSTCLAHDGNKYYILTVKHILGHERGKVEKGSGVLLENADETKAYHRMLGYLDSEDKHLIDVLLVEINRPDNTGPKIEILDVPDYDFATDGQPPVVYKVGENTGRTNGFIIETKVCKQLTQIADIGICQGYFVVAGNGEKFVDEGDSGALVKLNSPGSSIGAIGMVVAMEDEYKPGGTEYGFSDVAICVSLKKQLQVIKNTWQIELDLYEHELKSAIYLTSTM